MLSVIMCSGSESRAGCGGLKIDTVCDKRRRRRGEGRRREKEEERRGIRNGE
jgi:hypothetical protein